MDIEGLIAGLVASSRFPQVGSRVVWEDNELEGLDRFRRGVCVAVDHSAHLAKVLTDKGEEVTVLTDRLGVGCADPEEQ